MKGPSPGFSQAGLAKLFGVVTPDSASPTSSSNTGSIIGGVIAGVAGLVILIGAAWLFWYYKHIKKPDGKVIGPFELDTTPGQID